MFLQIQEEEDNKASIQKKIEDLEGQIRVIEEKFQESIEDTKNQA